MPGDRDGPRTHPRIVAPADVDPFMITRAERRVAALLGEAWNAFLLLPIEHGDDQDEFRRAIHQAQDLVLARVGRRQINDSSARA